LGSERWGIARGVVGNDEHTTLTRVSMLQWWMNSSSRRSELLILTYKVVRERRYPSENMPI
jgi:hypothetical protein